MSEAPADLVAGRAGYEDGAVAVDDAAIGPRREIGIRLTILARVWRNSFDREVVDLNITRSQWGLIAVVSRQPGATQRMIAEALEMSEASAGRLIDRLCADGLLERRDREDDKRARAIFLAPAAEPLLAQLGKIAEAREDRLFAGFSDKEIARLSSFIGRLYANATRV